ncbi:hypothetical protein ACFL23_00720 [Patescibacteria group bacterium]
MKINIPQKVLEPTKAVMQKLGFFENYDRHTGKISYIKRLSRQNFYPRYHVYIDEKGNDRIINLHIDQKKPSYGGSNMHSAEYDGDVVSREIDRMSGILEGMWTETVVPVKTGEKEKRGIFKRIFSIFKR